MKKKICVSILFAIFIASMLIPSVSAADSLTITDRINDVKKYKDLGGESEEIVQENITYPDADIEELKYSQDGSKVEITFKLADGGVLRPSETNQYYVILYTTSPNLAYFIYYTGLKIEYEGKDVEFLILDAGGQEYEVIDKDVGDNYFTISFELADKNEKCMSINGLVQIDVEDNGKNYSYVDSVPDSLTSIETGDLFTIEPVAGGPYTGKTGENIEFQGNLIDGNPSDYEWVWYIEQTEDYFYGQNVTHKFDFAGNYTGILYVYNDKGDFGYADFSVDISSAKSTPSTPGSESNSGSGSGITIFLILIAVIVIAGVAVVVVVLRR